MNKKLLGKLARATDSRLRRLWSVDPLASKPKAPREEYVRRFEEARHVSYPEVDTFEHDMGAAIDRSFLDDLAFHTQVTIKRSPLAWAHGRVLYAALTDYLRRSQPSSPADRVTILETGTARGFSALCMAKALEDAGRAGAILTTDILPNDAPIYWNCIDDLDGRKTRRDLLEPWKELSERFIVFLSGDSASLLPAISPNRIHFAYLDGGHTYADVMAEYERVGPRQIEGDIIVFDDVTPDQYPGIVKAVDEICSTKGYLRKTIAANARRYYVVATKAG